jgi:two-component system phosphate regulon sensor histidine kinase PhoR
MLAFCLGLAIGLAIMVWQQHRLRIHIAQLLVNLGVQVPAFPVVAVSQLAAEIYRQREVCQQLEQSGEMWRRLLQSAPIAYLHIDDENRLVWCNNAAQQLLAIPQWELVTPRLLLQLVRSYELDQLVDETRANQQPTCTDWVFHPPPTAFTARPEHSQRESVCIRGYGLPLDTGQVGVFLENRQEAEVLRQQRDRWASDVAHELKTPLTSIRLVAETLQSRLEPSLRAWVDRLLNEVIRLSNLVQDLLDLSQLQANTPARLNLQPINLVELVQAAWLNLEPLARKKHLQLDYIGDSSAIIHADEPRLYRVLVNLLDNSIKYSPPRQHIQVRISIVEASSSRRQWADLLPNSGATSQFISLLAAPHHAYLADADYVRLEIIDAGPGFQEHDLPYIFDRFYQADPSRSRSGAGYGTETPGLPAADPRHTNSYPIGSGLGLAIVRQIVEAHRGCVYASNYPETGGAWLQVILPCGNQLPTNSP